VLRGALKDEDIFCRKCDYNLRGLPAGRCPECGHEFNPAHAETFRRVGSEGAERVADAARRTLIQSGAAILAAQAVCFAGGHGAGFLGAFLFWENIGTANECLLYLACLLGILWVVKQYFSQRHKNLAIIFGICTLSLFVCEMFLPGFDRTPGTPHDRVNVYAAILRLSFGLWGLGLLCENLQRTAACFLANLLILGIWLIFVISLGANPFIIVAAVTSIPFLIFTCRAMSAAADGLIRG
jgi:hypothetical protein